MDFSGRLAVTEVIIGLPHCGDEHPEDRWLEMNDPYFAAIQEQWQYIRSLYMLYETEKPIMLYDVQEKKVYAYPYKQFREELSKTSQASLEQDYETATSLGNMVVFVRDNVKRKLVSYVLDNDATGIQ
jgi:hypothetical protein